MHAHKMALSILLAGLAIPAWAQQMGHDHAAPMAAVPAAATQMTDGEVRKVDKAGGKLTIKHGPIRNLDMPGMTMVFQAKDPALLEKVKVGDKVRFRAESNKGALVVTAIDVVK
jgi:Cu/Ag efflux protein CusF